MKRPQYSEIAHLVSELLLNEGYTKAELARYLETIPEAIDAVLMNMAGCCLVRAIKERLVCHCYA